MKRKKSALAEWSQAQIEEFRSTLVQETVTALAQEYGDESACLLGEAGRLIVGIPFPSLCLEYVFQNSVFPLERISQVVGIEGTFKSAFTAEVARWFLEHYGYAQLLEHETKFGADLAESIVGSQYANRFVVVPCDSINDWQKRLQFAIRSLQAQMQGTKERPGPGKIIPALFIVDSVMAKATEETQQKIEKLGYADRNFPDEARAITAFMRKVPADIRRWPFAILAVNHLKPMTNAQGLTERHKAGGRGLSFQETFEIELKRHAQYRQDRATKCGRRIVLEVYKNALGTDRLAIPVDIFWWTEDVVNEETGVVETRQRTQFCWHTTTVKLLMNSENKNVRQVVNFVPVRNRTAVACRELGISAESPLSLEEAGEVLMQSADIVRELRRILGIKERKIFQPGVDYDKQLQAAKAEVVPAVAKDGKVSEA